MRISLGHLRMNGVTRGSWLLAGVFVLPIASLAHHSFPVVYNTSQIVEIEGEITELAWESPHVRFVVETADGASWRIESNSAGGLERRALSRDVIGVGTMLRVAGYPARDGGKELYTSHILLPDGRELVLRPGIGSRWTQNAEAPREGP
jgi:hypothetical protein